jgi:hypothetical protein
MALSTSEPFALGESIVSSRVADLKTKLYKFRLSKFVGLLVLTPATCTSFDWQTIVGGLAGPEHGLLASSSRLAIARSGSEGTVLSEPDF